MNQSNNEYGQMLERFAEIPIMKTLSLEMVSVNAGEATMRMPYRREHDGVFETLHGGLMMTLADTAACVAVLTLAGPEARITTTDMNIRFLKGCRTDCTAVAKVIKFGRTLSPVEVRLQDAEGALLAIAQVTYMRLK